MGVPAAILSPFHVEDCDRAYLTALTCTSLSCRGLSPEVILAALSYLFDVLPFVRRPEEIRLLTSELAFNNRKKLGTKFIVTSHPKAAYTYCYHVTFQLVSGGLQPSYLPSDWTAALLTLPDQLYACTHP